MTYIGIDPGASGSMCILDTSPTYYDYKTVGIPGYALALRSLVDQDVSITVYLEKVASRTAQGVKSVFSFGQRFGELIGMLETLGINYTLIAPQTWQRAIGVEPKSGKTGIHSVVSEHYPQDLTGPRGGLLDGRCDALGIALYAQQQGA